MILNISIRGKNVYTRSIVKITVIKQTYTSTSIFTYNVFQREKVLSNREKILIIVLEANNQSSGEFAMIHKCTRPLNDSFRKSWGKKILATEKSSTLMVDVPRYPWPAPSWPIFEKGPRMHLVARQHERFTALDVVVRSTHEFQPCMSSLYVCACIRVRRPVKSAVVRSVWWIRDTALLTICENPKDV